ncbi:MAG: DUF5667 domain-containing protein [Minisyncoccia bacterium]
MKKLTAVSILFVSLAFVVPMQASAATSAGVKPGSFFYFFDTTSESISLFFTFNPEQKAKKALEYADERLAEIEAIAEEKNPGAVKTAIANYESNIALATEKSKEVKDKGQAESLLTSIADNASKNQEVLAAVLIKVPDEAKEAITQAIEASKRGQEEATKQIAELKSEVEKLKNEVAELKAKETKVETNTQANEVEKLKKEVETLKKQSATQPAPKQPAPTAQNSQEQKKVEETVLAVNQSEEFRKVLLNLISNHIDSFRFLNNNIDESINIFNSRIDMINDFISGNNRVFGLSSEQSLREIGLLWNEEYKKDIDRSQLFKDSYIEMKTFINQNEITPLETMAVRIVNKGTISKEEYLTELGVVNKYDSELNKFYDSIQMFFTRYKSDIKVFDDRYSRVWTQVNELVSLLNTNTALQNNLNQLRSLPAPKPLNCTFSSHFNGFGTVGSMNCY